MNDFREIVDASGGSLPDLIPFAPASELQTDINERPETEQEAEAAGPDELWEFWNKQISAALKHERRFRHEALEAENLYFGPEDDPGAGSAVDGIAGKEITDLHALVHANIEVMKPLLFSETPTPIVQRRFRGDGKADATALFAAEAGQRLAQYLLTTTPFDDTMELVRDDWLIAGRGVARVVYKAKFEQVPVLDPISGKPVVGEDGTPALVERKVNEEVLPEAKEWRRTLFAPAPSWKKLPWLAFEEPMMRHEIEARFGKEVADQITFNRKGMVDTQRGIGDEDRELRGTTEEDTSTGDPVPSPFDTATVWEIWNLATRRVIWWAPDYRPRTIIEAEDDLYGLEDFFPTPKPLLSTTRGGALVPRPDVRYYEAQAREADLASAKMASILQVLSISGAIPAALADTVKELLSGKNVIVPVSSWIKLMEKGGTSGIIQWLPVQEMIVALQALATLREGAKARMFESSGIADVMRSAGDPTNTATQANLEGRYAGMRLASRQRQIAVFARDLLRMMIEIAAEQFDTAFLADICALDLPLTEAERQDMIAKNQALLADFEAQAAIYQEAKAQIEAAAGAAGTDPAQVLQAALPQPPAEPELLDVPETSWELVHDRLRNDLKRKITISIETQSTILADEQADKEARIEFLTAFAKFVEMLLPLAATGQFPMKTAKELLLFGVRGFPKSRTLESLIAELPDELPQQGPPPEEPQIIVAKIRAEVDRELKAMDLADHEEERQHEFRLKGIELAADAAKLHGQPDPESPTPIPPQEKKES
jgi:hypothetical protein